MQMVLMPCSQIVCALPGIIYIGRMGIGEALICTQDNSTSGGSYTSAISLLGLDSEGREDEECGRVSACSAQTICEHADEAHTFDLPASMWHGILQFSDAACTHSRRTRVNDFLINTCRMPIQDSTDVAALSAKSTLALVPLLPLTSSQFPSNVGFAESHEPLCSSRVFLEYLATEGNRSQ